MSNDEYVQSILRKYGPDPSLLLYVQSMIVEPLSRMLDASIRIPAGSAKTREALAQYIVRPPVSLQKLLVDEGGPDTVV